MGSTPPKKAMAVPSAGKVMTSVFWYSKGQYYANLLRQLLFFFFYSPIIQVGYALPSSPFCICPCSLLRLPSTYFSWNFLCLPLLYIYCIWLSADMFLLDMINTLIFLVFTSSPNCFAECLFHFLRYVNFAKK